MFALLLMMFWCKGISLSSNTTFFCLPTHSIHILRKPPPHKCRVDDNDDDGDDVVTSNNFLVKHFSQQNFPLFSSASSRVREKTEMILKSSFVFLSASASFFSSPHTIYIAHRLALARYRSVDDVIVCALFFLLCFCLPLCLHCNILLLFCCCCCLYLIRRSISSHNTTAASQINIFLHKTRDTVRSIITH